jgi:hypothetical protein
MQHKITSVLLLGVIIALCAISHAEELEKAFLDAHNDVRSDVSPSASNMKKLTWDSELAKIAQTYAALCNYTANESKKDQSSGEYESVGENLYLEKGDYVSNLTEKYSDNGKTGANEVVEAWYEEWKNYSFETDSCQNDSLCDHFLQVTWADTESVGCAATFCPTVVGASWCDEYGGCTLVVCNYGEGSKTGESPFDEGSACSNCPSGYGDCEDNLCVPQECKGEKDENGDCIDEGETGDSDGGSEETGDTEETGDSDGGSEETGDTEETGDSDGGSDETGDTDETGDYSP